MNERKKKRDGQTTKATTTYSILCFIVFPKKRKILLCCVKYYEHWKIKIGLDYCVYWGLVNLGHPMLVVFNTT